MSVALHDPQSFSPQGGFMGNHVEPFPLAINFELSSFFSEKKMKVSVNSLILHCTSLVFQKEWNSVLGVTSISCVAEFIYLQWTLFWRRGSRMVLPRQQILCVWNRTVVYEAALRRSSCLPHSFVSSSDLGSLWERISLALPCLFELSVLLNYKSVINYVWEPWSGQEVKVPCF